MASILLSKEVTGLIRKLIRNRYNEKCADEEITKTLHRIILDLIDPLTIKTYSSSKSHRSKKTSGAEEKLIIDHPPRSAKGMHMSGIE